MRAPLHTGFNVIHQKTKGNESIVQVGLPLHGTRSRLRRLCSKVYTWPPSLDVRIYTSYDVDWGLARVVLVPSPCTLKYVWLARLRLKPRRY